LDILLATHRGSPGLTPSDRLLAEALEARGARVTAGPWDSIDPAGPPGSLVCIRSTWDYHLRVEEFRAWVSAFRVDPGRLWNSPETVLWNLDKGYLRGLERLGIALPITHWLPAGEYPDAGGLLQSTGWRQAVLKPRVSASAHGTILVTPESSLSVKEAASLSASGALLQEFIPEIRTRGELSLMYFGGEYSHAVCKEVAAGEFRVQPHLGGGARIIDAAPELRAFGERVLKAVPSPWVYARVDVVHAERGPLLMELELIEPELFFHLTPERADHLAHRLILLVARNAER
jgi:glutathione synthase/RimK-type ligase-like ATP-grasp enzyme